MLKPKSSCSRYQTGDLGFGPGEMLVRGGRVKAQVGAIDAGMYHFLTVLILIW